MIIQFFQDGEPTTERIDYEGTIWAEGQLSDADEDVIEHLGVGETAEIDGGWTVKRWA